MTLIDVLQDLQFNDLNQESPDINNDVTLLVAMLVDDAVAATVSEVYFLVDTFFF